VIDDRPTIDAFPGVEGEEVVGQPLAVHHSAALWTRHGSLLLEGVAPCISLDQTHGVIERASAMPGTRSWEMAQNRTLRV
jgi:hypothetical protein